MKGKLSIESNKAASYSRQLDLALNDARAKEQQLREKFNSNVIYWIKHLISLTKPNNV